MIETGSKLAHYEVVSAGVLEWRVTHPQWSDDGRELFFVSPERDLMSVPADPNASPIVSDVPEALFRFENNVGLFERFMTPYAVMPGGEQFLVGVLAEAPQPPIHIIVNWPAMLEE